MMDDRAPVKICEGLDEFFEVVFSFDDEDHAYDFWNWWEMKGSDSYERYTE